MDHNSLYANNLHNIMVISDTFTVNPGIYLVHSIGLFNMAIRNIYIIIFSRHFYPQIYSINEA